MPGTQQAELSARNAKTELRGIIEDEAVRELSRDHAATLNEVYTESARDEAGNFRRLETLFFAASRTSSD